MNSVKFKNFITLQRGFDLPKNKRHYGKYPVIASTSIDDYHNIYKVSPPGVVTGRSGSLGSVQYIKDKFWPLNTTLWVKDFKKNIPKYVYYKLKTLHLEKYNSGVGVPTLNRNHLDELKVSIHNHNNQIKISNILSNYDDYIENNLKRIKTLETIARNLYQEWFVNFRFPGYKDVKLKKTNFGKIPENCEINQLSNQCDLIKEKYVERVHQNYPLLDLGRFPRKTMLIDKTGKADEIVSSRIIFNEDDILFGSIRPYLHKVVIAPCEGVTNTSVHVIRIKNKKFRSLLPIILSSEETINWTEQYSTGLKMPIISWKNFRKMPIVIPNQKLLNDFDEIVWPIIEYLKLVYKINNKLADIREILANELISGKLDVSKLQTSID